MASLLAEAFLEESPTLVHRLREWVDIAGERPCIHSGENDLSLSYRDFDRLTDRLAAYLSRQGVNAGSRVVLFSDSSLLASLTMFAAWKLAAIYCPINARLPDEMLDYTLNDLAPEFIVSDSLQLEVLQAAISHSARPAAIVVCNDNRFFSCPQRVPLAIDENPKNSIVYLNDIDAVEDRLPAFELEASDVASIIYTSGTTSNPKGVIQKHAWLHALCATQSVWTHSDDVIHCDLPMYHIGGAFSLFARGIWAGASVALWDRFSASQYWHRIDQYGASIALLLDVMTDWLLESPESEGEGLNSLAKVHLQPLSSKHCLLAERFGIDYVLTGYGSSEVGNVLLGCIDESGEHLRTPKELWRGYSKPDMADRLHRYFGESVLLSAAQGIESGLMGVPSGFYMVDLLDGLAETSRGQRSGRLRVNPFLAGILFDGYLNSPQGTAAAGTDDVYLTPDYAQQDDLGRYYFGDREGGLLRVKGENVSVAAVEQKFLEHPGVSQCVAVGVPAFQGEENDIVIFVQPSPGVSLNSAELSRWSSVKLPTFMRPRQYRVIAEMPLTGTMKIDRGTLRNQVLLEASNGRNE